MYNGISLACLKDYLITFAIFNASSRQWSADEDDWKEVH